jgi:MOSC domain-containing protein
LRVTLPQGEVHEGDAIDEALSRLLERSVRLEASTSRPQGRLGATGAHHDLAPVHLIAASTLERLRAAAPESVWDARRFRPNLVLDDGPATHGFAEDELLGASLRGRSGLELTVELPTPRCVVPTRAHEELPADPEILRTIVREHRVDLGPFGRQGCVGAYAEVANEGSINVGERLEVVPGARAPKEALRIVIVRLGELSDSQ